MGLELPRETVLALDNVRLELPIAGAGSRALAAFLDYLIVIVTSILWAAACGGLVVWLRLGFAWFVALFLVGSFLIDYGYFATSEAVTGGRTFGKWAIDLKVVSRDGGKPGTAAFLLRNAVRTVDLLVGIPLMATDPLARRLGDRLAWTVVVHGHPRHEADLALSRVPRGWGGPEVALLEEFLRRERDLEPARRAALAARFLAWIERDDPGLLEGVERGADDAWTLRSAVGLGG